MSLQTDRGFPQKFIFAGIIVGLLLIFAGIIVGVLLIVFDFSLQSFGKIYLLSSLVTCVGFGIVLAAFGSKAGGSWEGWTASGAGAMAIILFLVLQHFTPPPLPPYKKGQLRGEFSKIADLRIIDESPMYEFRDRTTSSIRFILLDRKLKSQRMSIQVDTNEKGNGREFFELIGNSHIIHDRYLVGNIDDEAIIQWRVDYDKREVKDGDTVIFSEQDQLQENMLQPPNANHASLPPIIMPIGVALAGEVQGSGSDTGGAGASPDGSASISVSDLVQKLMSDDPTIRRNARDDLAAQGANAVSTIMAALRSHPSDYRTRSGVFYALSVMLREHPDQRSAISSALRDSDFPLLAAAASDDDRTIRFQAAEFLYVLQDPRAVPASVEAARNADQESKANNQLLIVRQSGQSFSDLQKQQIMIELTEGSGSNNDLVGDRGYLKRVFGCSSAPPDASQWYALAAAVVGASPVDAHGQKTQSAFLRMRNFNWSDVKWSKTTVNVNEEYEITGKVHVMNAWPAAVPVPDKAFLSAGSNVGTLGPAATSVGVFIGGQLIPRPVKLELGKTYEFRMVQRARRPGPRCDNVQLSIENGGLIPGPGQYIDIKGNFADYTDEVKLLNGSTVDLEQYGIGKIYLWHLVWFIAGCAWIWYWFNKRGFVGRFLWGASGKAEELLTPREWMIGAATLGGVLLVVIIFYAITTSNYPNTIPLQSGDFHNIQAIDEPPSPLKIKYVNGTYKVPGRELVANFKITNTGKEPLRIGEFNTAGLRFLNPDVYTSKVEYPDYLLADRGLSLSDNTPIAPGETRDVAVTIQDARWDTERLFWPMTSIARSPECYSSFRRAASATPSKSAVR